MKLRLNKIVKIWLKNGLFCFKYNRFIRPSFQTTCTYLVWDDSPKHDSENMENVQLCGTRIVTSFLS